VRTVLLGYGLAGRFFHGPLLRATEHLDVVGVLTSNAERAAQAQQDFPGVSVVADLDEAWALDPDLVVVAGPNVTHVPFARAALDHGVHVVVDKPVAGTAEEVAELAAHAAQHSVYVIPFQNRRWDSDFLTMQSVMASGRLGTIHRFESRFGTFKPALRGSWRESITPQDLGGNLYDLGSHLIDQALQLMGPISAVMAHARSVRSTQIADDDAVVLCTHVSGAISYLVGSIASADNRPRMLAVGTGGSARIEVMDSQEARLRAGVEPVAVDWSVEEHPIFIADATSEYRDRPEPLIPGRWTDFYAAVRDAVVGSAPPPIAIDDAVQSARVLDAARQSAVLKQSVILDPPAAHRR
jgi:scyllo-inositol 2-dehydrogenase (NADP+)